MDVDIDLVERAMARCLARIRIDVGKLRDADESLEGSNGNLLRRKVGHGVEATRQKVGKLTGFPVSVKKANQIDTGLSFLIHFLPQPWS